MPPYSDDSALTDPPDTGVVYYVGRDSAAQEFTASAAKLILADFFHSISSESFLSDVQSRPGCAVVDCWQLGISARELLLELKLREIYIPVVVIGSNIDINTVVSVMEAGAETFFEKPVEIGVFTRRLREAIEKNRVSRQRRLRHLEIRERFLELTTKEREVVDRVLDGRTNREIAESLNISVRAVEDRRSRIMRRMKADSLVQLVDFIREAEQEPA